MKSPATAIPESLARSIPALGLRWDAETLVVGLPADLPAAEFAQQLERVAGAVGSSVQGMKVPEAELREMVSLYADAGSAALLQAPANISGDSEGPIADLVNNVLDRSVRLRASDIHVEPTERDLLIRIRVDGALEELVRLPASVAAPFVSRLKVLAKMNIVERRRPQDGQFSVTIAARDIDVRLATAATLYGEKAVLRLLDTKRGLVDLEGLGMVGDQLAQYQHMIRSHYGMVIAAGPTGSGKTTTLHSSLSEINSSDRNVTTLEDPVEYVVEGINHIPVNDAIGATFAVQLRAILRQDPDIILIGEVRDAETARIGVQAALAGRLVMTSLHAPDAVGVIYRLIQMEIEPHLVAASLRGIVAQRLVRRVCDYCKVDYVATAAERLVLEQPIDGPDLIVTRGHGCSMCRGTGYRDRIGAFQIFEISDRMRELISTRPDPQKLYALAEQEGLKSIGFQAYRLAASRLTTVEEAAQLVGIDV